MSEFPYSDSDAAQRERIAALTEQLAMAQATIETLENKIEETETEYAQYRLDDLMRQADFTAVITRQAQEIAAWYRK